MVKRFVVWPFLPTFILATMYRHKELFIFYNKKFFDMCNVGVQYEVGNARNNYLKECNKLIDVEDF